MRKKRHTAEQIIQKLREAELRLSQGDTIGLVCKKLGVTEQTSCGQNTQPNRKAGNYLL
jgi:hypothetical protein